jgi:hypothetical protein
VKTIRLTNGVCFVENNENDVSITEHAYGVTVYEEIEEDDGWVQTLYPWHRVDFIQQVPEDD